MRARLRIAGSLVASTYVSHRPRFCVSPCPAPTPCLLVCEGRNVRLGQVLEWDFTGSVLLLLLFASLVFNQHVRNAQSASWRSSGRKEEAHAEYK